MNVIVDPDVCISCGMCVSLCPAVFRIADSGKAEAYADPSEADKGVVDEAADACPVSAIRWED